jgi:hypothetical protein
MATNNAINAPLPLTAANGGTGVASPTAHGILVAEGASAVTPIVLGAGQVLIGTTASDPVGATLSAGAGISITSATGSITIAATGNDPWTDVTGTTQTLAVNNGYAANNASLVTFTLPTTAAAGDKIEIAGKGAGGWLLAQNASQLIHLGSSVTTTGTGGSLASTNQFDTIILRCITANTTWTVFSVIGNLTVV